MKIKEIQEIIAHFEQSELETLELELEGVKLKLSKKKENQYIETKHTESENKIQKDLEITKEQHQIKQKQTSDQLIKSPLVGTFYAQPSPDQKPYVEVGQKVKKGTVLCIIEAMKIMNEIIAPKDGIIKEVHPTNGDVIQFDQLLFTIGVADDK